LSSKEPLIRLQASIDIWLRRLTAPLRKLPDFIIIGAQKAGTSSLFYYLSQHPQLRLAIQKEIHYYNYYCLNGKNKNWYRSFFPLRSSELLTGEASPYYLFDPGAPEKIKKDIPNVKLIALLRDPVDRAYSAYSMNARRASGSFPTFEQAIANEDMSHEASQVYLWRGLYAQHIRPWLAHFPREQLLFIKAEDFFRRPKESLKEVYEFLDIKEVYPETLKPQEVGSYSELSPQTRAELQHYYKGPNTELAELIGPDFNWD